MLSDTVALQNRLHALEDRLCVQESQHHRELERVQDELIELKRLAAELEEQNRRLDVVGSNLSVDQFVRKVEWTIPDFSTKEADFAKGQSIWSPKFRAAGIDGLQLEFFPKGREKTTFDGFCSLFLWCPKGTHIKYQLWVGSFLRAPDTDEYPEKIGHGHSNFCPVGPEVDRTTDSIVVGVNFLEVFKDETVSSRGVQLTSTSVEAMVAKEVGVIQNRAINKVVWKIRRVSHRMQHLPRGSSMWSELFSAGGIQEILLEFYPNGSANTTKDGFCAFYIRCPEGVSMIVTLIVGKVRKGPIKVTFNSNTAKGLPDFCPLQDELDSSDDSVEVSIELQNQPNKTLTIES